MEYAMRQWLLHYFPPAVLEQLVRRRHGRRAGTGRSSSIRQVMQGLHPHDYRLFRWLCLGQGEPQLAHLQRVMLQVARAPQRMPLIWLVVNPVGRSLLRGGQWSSGQAAQLDGESVTLLQPAPAAYTVQYLDGGKTFTGVREAQLFRSKAATAAQPPYGVGDMVWVEHDGSRAKAVVTRATAQWHVRRAGGATATVKVTRLEPSAVQRPQWAAQGVHQGQAPWRAAMPARWGELHSSANVLHAPLPAARKSAAPESAAPLQGVWQDATEMAQRTARQAVLETTRRALTELQRAAQRGAAQGAAEANFGAAQARAQQGAHAGTFTPEQRAKLLEHIRKGVHAGVMGTAASAVPEFAYEEDALLPMTVQGLPPSSARFAGSRCMSRCTDPTDPGACHAQRCTRTGAQPLLHATGVPLNVQHQDDVRVLQDVGPLLCDDWVGVARAESAGQVRLCPQCHGFLMSSLQLRSPNTLLLVR